MILGITGSSGAGKTTVCEILKNEYNFKIIIADDIARNLSKKGTDYFKEIVSEFGNEILLDNGELNRKKIANIIYNNKENREKLNNCTFKYIVKEIKEQISKQTNNNIAIDAPLLFEANLDKLCDITVAVISESLKEQVNRIIKRDNISEEEATARIRAQQTNDFYIENCNYKIINNNDLNKQIGLLIGKVTSSHVTNSSRITRQKVT